MKLPLPQLPGAKVSTNSRRQCFLKCRRKAFYAYELGWRPIGEAKALRLGDKVHYGLDMRAQGEKLYVACGAGCDLEDSYERVIVANLLNGYFWYWEKGEHRPEITIAEYLETEQVFEHPIRNPATGRAMRGWKASGKKDKVVRLADGRKALIEHKTTRDDIAPGADYWLRWRMDAQVSAYAHSDDAIDCIILDAIRTPSIEPRQIPVTDDEGLKIVVDANGERVYNERGGKPRQSADKERGWTLMTRTETPEEFGERLRIDIGERPEFYYQRKEIPRLSADMAEFERELHAVTKDYAEAQRLGKWYRNTGACVGFGTCPYLSICQNPIEDPSRPPEGFRVVEHLHEELV